MADCKACVDNCILITQECLCSLTGLKQTLVELKPNIEHANAVLEEMIGETCMTNLCADETTETASLHTMLANKKFQLYYSYLIKYDWICESGSGQITPAGYAAKQSDEFSDFRILSGDEVQRKIEKAGRKLSLYRKNFKTYLEENHTACVDCETKTCGCTTGCSCDCPQASNHVVNYCMIDDIAPI